VRHFPGRQVKIGPSPIERGGPI